MYLIEKHLSSTKSEKTISATIAISIIAIILFLATLVSITLPDPPIKSKMGAVEIDFGLVDGGFGEPDQGGPTKTPPAKGSSSGSSSTSEPAKQTASQPKTSSSVVTNKGATIANLPKIKMAESTGAKVDSRLSKIKGSNTKKGIENGSDEGEGIEGTGKGKKPGIEGDGGLRPGARGTGGIYASFKNFTISNRKVKITADGKGKISCRLRVNCDGKWDIIEVGVKGTTYSGNASNSNLSSVFRQAMRGVTFTKTGEICPEEKVVMADIQPE